MRRLAADFDAMASKMRNFIRGHQAEAWDIHETTLRQTISRYNDAGELNLLLLMLLSYNSGAVYGCLMHVFPS